MAESQTQSGTATAGNSDSSSETPQTSFIPDAMKQYMQEFAGMMQETMQTTLDRQMPEFVQTTLKRKRPDTDSEGSEPEENGDEEGAESPAARVAHVAESDILVVQENASADIESYVNNYIEDKNPKKVEKVDAGAIDRGQLFAEIEKEQKEEGKVRPKVSDGLALIISGRFSKVLNETFQKTKFEEYNRPENCEKLVVPIVNRDLWFNKIGGKKTKTDDPLT